MKPAGVFVMEKSATRGGTDVLLALDQARASQRVWAAKGVRERLRLLRDFRHALAASAEDVASTVPCEQAGSLRRKLADTLVAEVLPLAEACRFLEREAEWVLRPQHPGGEPFWLRSVRTEIRREPLGVVLIIAPSNYPLFLPGVQALQALAAGNAVLWKPGPGGSAAALSVKLLLTAAGLDPALLQVLDPSPESGSTAIREGVDKVFLTGSARTGQTVLRALAETLTPSVMELSGCDAVFVLDGADVSRVVDAITFGLRLNGSATCMAPRRVFVTKTVSNRLVGHLATVLDQLEPVPVTQRTFDLLLEFIADATMRGGRILLNGLDAAELLPDGSTLVCPTLVSNAAPEMMMAQTDIFAPVLSVMEVVNQDEALAAYRKCPYRLTASVFGPRKDAERMAERIAAGTVLVNDVIVSTADPRAPFGGRGKSGFGSTRGREGLLEMTAVKTIQVQRSRDRRAYAATTPEHVGFFAGYIEAAHGGKWRSRFEGMRKFIRAAGRLS